MAEISVKLRAGSRAAKASAVAGSVCCVVGGSSTLGHWDPKASPKLTQVLNDVLTWEGIVSDAKLCSGEQFKFCIWNGHTHEYVWEESGSMHTMPMVGLRLQAVFEEASSDTTSRSLAVSSPSAQTDKLWKVVGGNTSGVLVREGCPLTSTELGRLSTGSLVQEIEIISDRLHYQKLSGDGPAHGWMSLRLKGKDLVARTSQVQNEFGTSSKEQDKFESGRQAQSAAVSAGTLKIQVTVDHARSPKAAEAGKLDSAACCLVGGIPALGSWDPKQAPKLSQRRVDRATTIWEGCLDGIEVDAGEQYKYCIFDSVKHLYVWEESGPMHFWPTSAAVHEFEAQQVEAAPVATWPPPTTVPRSAPAAELGSGAEIWIPWTEHKRSPEVPHSMFHAFHWPFSFTSDRLRDIGELGFAAVQISPAQKSKAGGEWWTRYQPQDYLTIDGLGSWEDLRNLCEEADSRGVLVIADVVFNHMLVVANCQEWKSAQKSPQQLAALKRRLSDAVGPVFDAEDFQWPWFEMSGEHWDNDNRYEGWGNGEWSELRHCEKVVKVQQQHLQLLLDAGVRGLRFDAVKHMRPEHLAELVSYVRKSGQVRFAYGEVLTVDASMHSEYMESLAMPSTDFPLTVYMNSILMNGPEAASEDVATSCAKAAHTEGLEIRHAKPDMRPGLCGNSIRFARNHDTVMNPGSFYGLSGSCLSARTCWAWLLSLHDGSVLVFPEDLQSEVSAPLICRALRFRAKLADVASSSEVGLLYLEASGPPGFLIIALRNAERHVCGLTLINLQRTAVKVTSCSLFKKLGPCIFQDEQGSTVKIHDDILETGSGAVSVQALDAAFLVAT
eukprot:s6497_g4.t1